MTENRQREDRIDEELAARQERLENTIDGAKNLKLAIPDKVQKELDEAGRVGRWVADDPTRMAQMTDPLHGYRPVDGVKPVSTRNGKGEPIKLKLMSKRKDFIEDDKRRREEARRETEEAQLSAADAGPGFYADQANKFTRGGSG
jgi:hypothetical protein